MMRLYSYWRSSSAWRVRLGLSWKRLPHELVTVHLARGDGEQNESAFRERNPLGQVPVLEVTTEERTLRLTQSMAILEYLDERFPERPLLPVALEDRAVVRQLSEIVNSGTQPLQNLSLRKTLEAGGLDAKAFMRGAIARGLTALEAVARHTAGRHLVRDGVTLADIYLVPQLYNARRFAVDLAPYPTLVRVDARCALLAEFQSAHPNAQPDCEAET